MNFRAAARRDAPIAPSRRSGANLAPLVLWCTTFLVAGGLALLSLVRLDRNGGGLDLAIFTQYTWLLGHGIDPFNTVNGKPLLGDHIEPGLALFAPLGALGLGPDGLVVAQAVVLALVGPVLYAIARAVGVRPWLACVVPALWFVSPLTYGPSLFEFHPETAAPLFLALAALGLISGRTWLFVAGVILAISLKEDIALTFAALGAAAALLGHRRLGWITAVGALTWFVVSVVVLLPAFGRSIQDDYGPRFAGSRGDSLSDVVRWGAAHPGEALASVLTAEDIGILVLLIVATAGLCLLAPVWLLVALPSLLANFASAYPPQHSVWFQYYIVPWGAVAVAAAVGVGAVSRSGARARFLAVSAAAAVGVLSVSYATQRLGELVTPASATTMPAESEIRRAVSRVHADEPVAVAGRLAASLADRREIYVLPFPFLGKRPGETWTRAELDRRARGVRIVIYDRTQPTLPEFAAWYRQIPGELRRQGFHVSSDTGSIVVFER